MRGFNNSNFQKSYEIVNLASISKIKAKNIDSEALFIPLQAAVAEPIPLPEGGFDIPEYSTEETDIDEDIEVLLENMCDSPDICDQQFYQSLSKGWSERISKGNMRHYLLNDVIYCAIIKILTEKDSADLVYTLPQRIRRALNKGEYSIRNGYYGLLYFCGIDDSKVIEGQYIWHDFRGNRTKAEGYCVPPKLRWSVIEYFHTALELIHQGSQRLQAHRPACHCG